MIVLSIFHAGPLLMVFSVVPHTLITTAYLSESLFTSSRGRLFV